MSDTKRLVELLSIEESHAKLQTELFACQQRIAELEDLIVRAMYMAEEEGCLTSLPRAFCQEGASISDRHIDIMREGKG